MIHTFSPVLRLLNRYSYTKGNVRKIIKFFLEDLFSYTLARKYRSVGAHTRIYTTVDTLYMCTHALTDSRHLFFVFLTFSFFFLFMSYCVKTIFSFIVQIFFLNSPHFSFKNDQLGLLFLSFLSIIRFTVSIFQVHFKTFHARGHQI